MAIALGLIDDFSDPRDAFRNGFLSAILHMRGQHDPTQAQVREAHEELCRFRLIGEETSGCPSGHLSHSRIDVVVDPAPYGCLGHETDSSSSSRRAG